MRQAPLPRILAAALIVFAACGTGKVETTPSRTAATAADPVTIAGTVTKVSARHVFEIGRSGGSPLLVIAPGVENGVRPGSLVEVTGRVRAFNVVALAAEVGVPLAGFGLETLEGAECLVASAVVSVSQ